MNVIAVDVGTTSVRLAIISFQGETAREANILASHKKDIAHHQDGHKFEQSSKVIWSAICECSRECIKKSMVPPDSIKSIAFSATCSFVIQEDDNASATINDIIMWMDHRAIKEAQKITSSDSKVLNQFGGVCSPEFSLSKFVWLKENQPNRFDSAIGFFELPDWLVYRCIGGNPSAIARSICCMTCKWGYDVQNKCHCDIINSLDSRIKSKIGDSVLGPGEVAGFLCLSSATELGLFDELNFQNKENLKPLKIAVGTSLIDAHAGILAMLSVPLKSYNIDRKVESTLCSLAGTSTCHMLLSRERNFTRGIWGPYTDVVLQGYHLLEAGQSLTGKLIEMSIESHEKGKMRLKDGERMYDIISSLNKQAEHVNFRGDLHVLPTFHGNRSPLANPRLRGGIYGLSTEGPKSLLDHYMATVESIAYETRLIIETLEAKLETILVSGGLMKNVYYMQTLADVLRCQVIKMSIESVDFMVMGSGLAARNAAIMNTSGEKELIGPLTKENIENIQYRQLDIKIYQPRANLFPYHEKRYLCYKEFVECSQRIDKIMHLLG